MALEREYLCLLPLCLALLLAFRLSEWSLALRAFGVGGLIGAIVSIKPPLLIYFPFFLVAMVYWDERDESAAVPDAAETPRVQSLLRRLAPK